MSKVRDTCRITGEVMKLTEHQKQKQRKKSEKAVIFQDNTDPLLLRWLKQNGYKLSDRRVQRVNNKEVIIHNHPIR